MYVFHKEHWERTPETCFLNKASLTYLPYFLNAILSFNPVLFVFLTFLIQGFVSDVHYFVVREYVSQLMKNNYSCKNRKNVTAASRIEKEWDELCELFREMVHTLQFPISFFL